MALESATIVSSSPIRILNVDDNDGSRYVLTQHLKQAGFHVLEAGSGEEALHKLSLNPDVVILDVRLPDMSGFDVCRRIRTSTHTSTLPVLMLSAVHIEDKDKIEGLEGGADVYLTNPVEINVLVATIHAMIRARSAESDLLRAAHRWQTTFDTMNDAICIVDLRGVITQCNKAMENLLERPAAELVNASFLELIDMDLDEDNPLTQVQKNQKRAETVIRFQRRWLNFAADPILDITGSIREFICILIDVTEVREYMLRLQMSNAELENFASVASHDLREPLNKIQIFSSRLYQKYEHVLGKEGHEYFERMQGALQRGMELIEDLLEYSKITTEARAFSRVDLNKVIQDVLSDLEYKVKQAGATIEVEAMPTIEANESQMYRLFQNLLSNALKYRHATRQPLIRVFASTTHGEPQYSQVHVSDNGIGINEEDFERIFGLFVRLHGNNEYKGTGIGLAICKKLVDQHNGIIQVLSVLNEGSEFIVKLPRKQKSNTLILTR